MDQVQYRNNEEMEIDLLEVLSVLLQKAWIIILTTLLGALIAGLYTYFLITPLYQSTTSFYVVSRQSEGAYTSSDLTAANQLTNDYAEIIKSRTVAETVIDNLNLNITPTQLINKISVSTPSSARVVYIKVLDPSPEMAMKIANSVRRNASNRIAEVMSTESVNVIDTANLPTGKYSPSLSRNVAIGGLLAAVVTCAVILFFYITNDTIKTSDDVEKYLGLSTLGTIPAYQTENTKKKKRKRSGK